MNEANSSEKDTDLTTGSFLFRLANGWLTTSKEEKSTKALKSDWVAVVKSWINRFDLAVSSPLSDFVKLGVETQKMLMALRRTIDEPYALGILVEGFEVKTYFMDLLGEGVLTILTILILILILINFVEMQDA
ncbi:hypothetical protein BC941DRAFT_455267 [Chlamydoabsidia padenii]|nr:hypothetical protein BC941DRAFT_455267 [Chlamydoabsidia padenii]